MTDKQTRKIVHDNRTIASHLLGMEKAMNTAINFKCNPLPRGYSEFYQ